MRIQYCENIARYPADILSLRRIFERASLGRDIV